MTKDEMDKMWAEEVGASYPLNEPYKEQDAPKRVVSKIATSVEQFTVSVTVSKKHLGDLISITVGETRKSDGDLMTSEQADAARKDAADALLVQANSICEAEVEKRAAVQVAAVKVAGVGVGFTQTATTTAVPGGTMTMSAPVVGAGAPAVMAAANGAPVSNDGWMSVPSKFGDGDMRFLTTAVYSQQQMEADVAQFLLSNNLNPQFFKIWDNRSGARGLENGVSQGSVANIKLIDGAPGAAELGKVPAARAKFNTNGSLAVWFTKEFQAALRFVGPMLAPGGAPAQNPFQ